MFRMSLLVIAVALVTFGAFGTTVAAIAISGLGPVQVV
jgi:hypothetical protein